MRQFKNVLAVTIVTVLLSLGVASGATAAPVATAAVCCRQMQ
ncbi:hypothetical protein [Cellulomonas sp. NPDC089187]